MSGTTKTITAVNVFTLFNAITLKYVLSLVAMGFHKKHPENADL